MRVLLLLLLLVVVVVVVMGVLFVVDAEDVMQANVEERAGKRRYRCDTVRDAYHYNRCCLMFHQGTTACRASPYWSPRSRLQTETVFCSLHCNTS